MKNRMKAILRGLVAAGAAGALLGGAAYAMNNDKCWWCYPCGSASDGGAMMCCNDVPC